MPRPAARLAAIFVALALTTGARAQTAPSASATSIVHIVSRPRGAEVHIDDSAPIGRTPILAARIAPGWHTLHFALPGYIDYDLRAQIGAGHDSVRIALVRAATLSITSMPTHSTVSLDGSDVGESPIEIGGLRAGVHRVEVHATGHATFSRDVTLRGGATTRIRADLEIGIAPSRPR